MRILVNEGRGRSIHLYLPTGIVANRVSASLIATKLKNKNMNISGRQIHLLFRAIKAYKATHPEWKLVEIHSCNGETVEIVV